MHRWLMLCCIYGILVGCTATPRNVMPVLQSAKPDYLRSVLTTDPLLPTGIANQQQLFALQSTQIEEFLGFYHSPEQQSLLPHFRLVAFLKRKLDGFHYKGQTLAAAQSYAASEGNCLSLALLTAALAKQVGIEVAYQKVNVEPIYDMNNGLLTLSSHVRVHLLDPTFVKQENAIVIRRPRVIVDYFPSSAYRTAEKVSEQDVIAMFYQNIASQRMIAKEYQQALAVLNYAAHISPHNPETLNSMAVTLNRLGQVKQAEALYQYVLEHTLGSVNAIDNYANLLSAKGEFAKATRLEQQTQDVRDKNPFRWIVKGNALYSEQKFRLAQHYYQKALKIAPYIHQAHFGLAKAYAASGQTFKSKQALQEARNLAYLPKDIKRYVAKLHQLSEKH